MEGAMSDRTIESNEEDIELEIDGEIYLVSFSRTTKIVTDSDYGADADGNRGESRDFVDDDEFEEVYVKDADGNDKALKEYPADFQESVETAIQNWMDDHVPD
jgi:hypothetical protein